MNAGLTSQPAGPAKADRRKPGRLRRRAEFLAAAGGRKIHSQLFTLQVRVRDDQNEPRIGFTITRRVGGAVERNRIRRRLRAAVSAVLPGGGHPGHDYVIVARRPLLEADYDTILGELRGALGRAHRKATGRAGQ